MSVPLSREGLALLELLPQWQLRAHVQPADDSPWGGQCRALIVAVVPNDASRRLWANIGKAMRACGLPHDLWADAQLFDREQSEQALQSVMAAKPGVLLIVGDNMKNALLDLQPGLAQWCSLHCAPGLETFASGAHNKRRLFALLAKIKREAL